MKKKKEDGEVLVNTNKYSTIPKKQCKYSKKKSIGFCTVNEALS